MITENTVDKQEYRSDIGELKSDVRLIAERMDERFDDMNGKFRMMFTFMTLGFTILSAIMVVMKFLA
jgi:hypothetical protein